MFIPFGRFKNRATAERSISETASKGAWREVGIDAVDDRVVWTVEDDGIWLRYREEKA